MAIPSRYAFKVESSSCHGASSAGDYMYKDGVSKNDQDLVTLNRANLCYRIDQRDRFDALTFLCRPNRIGALP